MTMTKTKNRKSFMAVIQIVKKKRKRKSGKATARVYRIKQNHPVSVGFLESIRINTAASRDEDLINFLKYNGEVLPDHSLGNEFILKVV